MQVAVFDYSDNSITIFNLSDRVAKLQQEDDNFNLSEYMESLPGYSAYCYFMCADNNIKIRFGDQSDFEEFKDEQDG